jgi:hypothetical protein
MLLFQRLGQYFIANFTRKTFFLISLSILIENKFAESFGLGIVPFFFSESLLPMLLLPVQNNN